VRQNKGKNRERRSDTIRALRPIFFHDLRLFRARKNFFGARFALRCGRFAQPSSHRHGRFIAI
jgi:hypothetical protein